jgi:hypothetical protein
LQCVRSGSCEEAVMRCDKGVSKGKKGAIAVTRPPGRDVLKGPGCSYLYLVVRKADIR